MFENVKPGESHLFTVDKRGLNLVPENQTIGFERALKHTNVSNEASIGGQARFGEGNTVEIDPYSGRFGQNSRLGREVTAEQWSSTVKMWESLGYEATWKTWK